MKLILSRTLVVVSVLLFGAANAEAVERIAAVVNDEVISVYDLNARLSLAIATSGLENRLTWTLS